MDTGIVRDGWLLKSPPEKNFCKAVKISSLRPKWHKRWFVLKPSGQLPDQFVLEYYTDSSCKKRKGQIDLDQCERVDSGLTFTNKKDNFRFMFDIRTPKRVYYLVAESEADMLKWVDCICHVCGLKIEAEDDVLRPNLEPVLVSPLATTPGSVTPSPSASNLTSVPSDSSPYIPISECITGKPIANGYMGSSRSSDTLNLVMLPMRRSSADNRDLTDEFYDHPRSNCVAIFHHSQSNVQELCRIPPAMHMHAKSEDRSEWDNGFIDDDSLPLCPPKVNWNTFPHDQTLDKSLDPSTYDVPTKANDMPSFVVLDPVPKNSEFKIKGHKYVRCEKVKLKENIPAESTSPISAGAPPRPPKPAYLDKRKYENFDPESSKAAEPVGLYDVPASSLVVTKEAPKSLQGDVFSFIKDDSLHGKDLSPTMKVPLGMAAFPSKENMTDDMYDFPRSRVDSRNATPSKSSLKARSARQHAYTNAPPGCLNAKDSLMNYEYRPTLSTDNSLDAAESDVSVEAESPLSPSQASGGMYANLSAGSPVSDGMIRVPPQINRDLKPKKKSIDNSDGPGFLNLAPPPAPKIGSSKFNMSKQRPGHSPTPGHHPAIPYRPSQSDVSDEDLSSCGSNSRRNSANDDNGKHWVPPAPRKLAGEIQYLELDIDSESGIQPERSNISTVYKTVDFVKTKVFNEMRQNVEESYRKSQ